jgi:thiol-disulfide isomerase/thioredoxin
VGVLYVVDQLILDLRLGHCASFWFGWERFTLPIPDPPDLKAEPSFILDRVNIRAILAVLGVTALLAFLVWGLVSEGDGGLEIGEPVPVATLPTLSQNTVPPSQQPSVSQDDEGSLADFRGDWVLLNVWASWCVPCREESPALERFAAENSDAITVLGVDTRDLTEDAIAFLREYGIEYPQLRDASGEYADDLKTTGVPESFLIDPAGDLVARFPGPFRNLAEIEQFAAPALEDSR